jgi:hypothetical protein
VAGGGRHELPEPDGARVAHRSLPKGALHQRKVEQLLREPFSTQGIADQRIEPAHPGEPRFELITPPVLGRELHQPALNLRPGNTGIGSERARA